MTPDGAPCWHCNHPIDTMAGYPRIFQNGTTRPHPLHQTPAYFPNDRASHGHESFSMLLRAKTIRLRRMSRSLTVIGDCRIMPGVRGNLPQRGAFCSVVIGSVQLSPESSCGFRGGRSRTGAGPGCDSRSVSTVKTNTAVRPTNFPPADRARNAVRKLRNELYCESWSFRPGRIPRVSGKSQKEVCGDDTPFSRSRSLGRLDDHIIHLEGVSIRHALSPSVRSRHARASR